MYGCIILYRTASGAVIAERNEDGTIMEFANRDEAIAHAEHEFIEPCQIVELDEL